MIFFFFKQKTAYEIYQCDWSSDVCSSDLASGGVYPGLVDKIIKFMGNDVLIQAGGGIHGHPDGTFAGAKAMRQAVDATLGKIPFKKYAETHKELRRALEKWGQ